MCFESMVGLDNTGMWEIVYLYKTVKNKQKKGDLRMAYSFGNYIRQYVSENERYLKRSHF